MDERLKYYGSMDERLKYYGIGALALTILISLGFVVTQDDTHFCRALGIAKACGHLSKTGATCYPSAANNLGSKYCSSGWEIILKDIPQTPDESNYNIGTVWECSPDGCARIK